MAYPTKMVTIADFFVLINTPFLFFWANFSYCLKNTNIFRLENHYFVERMFILEVVGLIEDYCAHFRDDFKK